MRYTFLVLLLLACAGGLTVFLLSGLGQEREGISPVEQKQNLEQGSSGSQTATIDNEACRSYVRDDPQNEVDIRSIDPETGQIVLNVSAQDEKERLTTFPLWGDISECSPDAQSIILNSRMVVEKQIEDIPASHRFTSVLWVYTHGTRRI